MSGAAGAFLVGSGAAERQRILIRPKHKWDMRSFVVSDSKKTESFFQLRLESGCNGLRTNLQLYLGRYRVLEPARYEQMWLEASGESIHTLLEQRKMDRDQLEQLAMEIFRYSCKLRGYRSPWLNLSEEELMTRIIEFKNNHLSCITENFVVEVARCKYNPPGEILRLLPVPPEDEYQRSGSTSPSTCSSSPHSHGRRAPLGVISGSKTKPSKFLRYHYAKLMRQSAERAQPTC